MSKENSINEKDQSEDLSWIDVVINKSQKVQYGSIVITIHDGNVTQVESIEKTRFAPRRKEE